MHYDVTQQLRVIGTDVQKVVEFIAGPDSAVDFHKVLPIPEALHVELSSVGNLGIAALTGNCERYLGFPWVSNEGVTTPEGFKALIERDHPEAFELAREFLSNKEKFGFMTWTEWCLHHWGTTWNAYAVGEWQFDGYCAKIRYDTAQHAAAGVILGLSFLFPGTEFKLRYFNQDLSLGGQAWFMDGVHFIDNFRRSESGRMQELYREIFGKDLPIRDRSR